MNSINKIGSHRRLAVLTRRYLLSPTDRSLSQRTKPAYILGAKSPAKIPKPSFEEGKLGLGILQKTGEPCFCASESSPKANVPSFNKTDKSTFIKHKLIVIVGPTASGKSVLAVKIAKKINGEIISADSRQVYKDLNLASGKITKKEMMGVPHHCMDLVSAKTVFTAERYSKCAGQAIKNIFEHGKTPIIVGGTGFYIDIALGRIKTARVAPDWKLRACLEKKSPDVLLKMLKKLDHARAVAIDPKNKRRLIRAIEIAKKLSKSDFDNLVRFKDKKHKFRRRRVLAYMQVPSDYDILWIGIKTDAEKLRRRINKRLALRLKAGMVDEIKKLHANPPSSKGISWKRFDSLGLESMWISKHLRGKISKEEMIEKLQTLSWRYSRRQMTWFRRNKNIHWVSSKREAEKLVLTYLEKNGSR